MSQVRKEIQEGRCLNGDVMAESNEERQKRELRELEGKNIAHYQTLLSTWIETRMEQDKMVITLSAAAIGLLVTIVTTVGIRGFWQYFFAVGSFAGFIIATCGCLHIFQVNAKHLEENLRCKSTDDTSKLLKKLDRLTIVCFYAGIICAVLMAIFVSFQKTGGVAMADKGQDAPKKVEKIQESLNGVKNLSPDKLEVGKSLNGIANLAPQNLQSSAQSTPQDSAKPSGGQGNSEGKEKK